MLGVVTFAFMAGVLKRTPLEKVQQFPGICRRAALLDNEEAAPTPKGRGARGLDTSLSTNLSYVLPPLPGLLIRQWQ